MIDTYIRLVRITVLGGCLVPLTTIVCSRLMLGYSLTWPSFMFKFTIALLAAAGIFLGFLRLTGKRRLDLAAMSREQQKFLGQIPARYVDLAILGSAGLSLFLELALIRWQMTVFPLFAAYKNFGLLSCFAGLGLGYALANRARIPLLFVIPLLALQVGLLIGLRYMLPAEMLCSIWSTPIAEEFPMGARVASTITEYLALYLLLAVVFLLSSLSFIPVGQVCGHLMERRPRLRAYGFNLLGSIAGVALMLLLSLLWTPPPVWFAVALAGLLALQVFAARHLALGAAGTLVALVVLCWPVSFMWERIYSPYQLLERGQSQAGGLMTIRAAGTYYQRVHDLSAAAVSQPADPAIRKIADYYNLPYKLHDHAAHVAVVGAGTGNDVAAALRAGVESVDAVEIDPAILQLGAAYHPEKPYDDPRVHMIVDDARSFLRTTGRSYDLIVYGLLDSHTLLSIGSGVRLDSYVYTVEGLREARARLADDGVLILSFCARKDLARKIYMMMREAFDGRPPTCISAQYDAATVFVQGNRAGFTVPAGLLRESGFEDTTAVYADASLDADPSTDDWPFLYMPRRVYPVSYLIMVGLLMLLSAVLSGSFIREKPEFSHVAFFFLGAGFMLIETKGITELGLTFGNTWQVIGIVLIGILSMAFLANCFVQWFGITRLRMPFVLLMLSLAFGLVIAWRGGLPATFVGRIAAVVVLTGPVFFSGMVFSAMLGTSKSISGVMAANLLGAMCGGVLEYNAMYFGFR
ncbi:MAG: hypothetical protein KAV82_14285, partial [Phycisphaerae bacterium]|nr:hypothetical protein [Phycisphaerae bacterium]